MNTLPNLTPTQLLGAKSFYLELYAVRGEQMLASATGFLVKGSRHYLVTNRHNVRGENNSSGKLLGGVRPTFLVATNFVGVRLEFDLYQDTVALTGQMWFEDAVHGGEVDLAILPINDFTTGLNPLVLDQLSVDFVGPAQDVHLAPTEIVSVIGFPHGNVLPDYKPIWVTGFLASEVDDNYKGLPAFLIDARTKKGQSGSPVYAFRSGSFRSSKMLAAYLPDQSWFLGIYSGRVKEKVKESDNPTRPTSPETDIGIVWSRQILIETIQRADYKD